MTQARIEPTTFQFVAQCLNQRLHCVLPSCCGYSTAHGAPTLSKILLPYCILLYIVLLMQDTFFHELYFTVVLQINLTHFPHAQTTCSAPVSHPSNVTLKFLSSPPTHAEVQHYCVHGHDKCTILYYSSVSSVFEDILSQKLCTHSFPHQPH
jgi:hypothetical protein